ncbi:MAG TPA: apolipoprotein N-acyltransferase [Bacteroidia bacterium]|nr:apolipoprotein N-acyltransferase [Bacteroidia bacterium]
MLAVLSGVLLALCYAPWNVGDLVWVWASPLLAALWFSEPRLRKKGTVPRWRHGFRLGYLAGFTFFAINVSWIAQISKVAGTFLAGAGALVGMGLYFGLYFAAFGTFAATVGRWSPPNTGPANSGPRNLLGVLKAAALNGAAWCGLEWLRGILFTGFGWNGLGVALKDHLALAQFADVIGITGYGFILMFVGTMLFCTFVRMSREIRWQSRLRPYFDFASAASVVVGLFLYGLPKMMQSPSKTVDLRARILQLNIPLEDKWSEDLAKRQKIVFDYRDLTRAFVETDPPDLVLWPETAVPGIFSYQWVQEYLNDHVLKGDSFYLVTGLEDTNLESTEIYNTLTVMQGNTASYQMHKKAHLVPFGEYIPFRHSFPIFAWMAGGIIEQDFTPGKIHEPLVVEKLGQQIGIIPLICFEDTVPRHTRKFLRPGPQIFVNVTNDGWFYDSAQPQQHFDNALFRCIEFRRPMIRAANTGVSGFIDERGSVYDRTGRDTGPRIVHDTETGSTYIRGSLPATLAIDLDPPTTIYARIGDSFSMAMGALALLAVAGRWWRKRRE